MRELIDIAQLLSDGQFDAPADLADRLERTAEAFEHVLDPAEFEDQTPDLVALCGVLVLALAVAAGEAAANNGVASGAYLAAWKRVAIATWAQTPGDQQRDLLYGNLHQFRQLAAGGDV